MQLIPKPPHGSEEWLLIRKQDAEGNRRISASNAAAVHNEHRYMTSAQLAAELLDPNPPQVKETNAAMERGNALEPALLQWASDQHKVEITTPEDMYLDGRMIATLDGVAATGEVYEAKTTNSTWLGELPRQWYWQGVQQAICASTKGVWWVVLDGRLELHMHWQPVSPPEKIRHQEAVDVFLAAIDMGMFPTAANPTYADIATAHPAPTLDTVDWPDTAADMLRAYEHAKQVADEAVKHADSLKADIAAGFGDAEQARIGDDIVATWKVQTRNSVDTKRLFAEHPELKDQYQTSSTFRVLRLKAEK